MFAQGYVFDSIEGSAKVVKGIAHTDDFLMKGPQALVLAVGDVNLQKETQSLKISVEPEINAGVASLAYVAINPIAGIGAILGQWALKKPIQKLFEFELMVDGTWDEPQVRRVTRNREDAASSVAVPLASQTPPQVIEAKPVSISP